MNLFPKVQLFCPINAPGEQSGVFIKHFTQRSTKRVFPYNGFLTMYDVIPRGGGYNVNATGNKLLCMKSHERKPRMY